MTDHERPVSSEPSRSAKVNLEKWFWGGIGLAATLTLGLVMMASWRPQAVNPPAHLSRANLPVSNPVTKLLETSAAQFDEILRDVPDTALTEAKNEIGPLLDKAYQPAYDAIPAYADFHYSVWGEYSELTAAALGSVQSELQARLLKGLDSRLDGVARDLDGAFDDALERALAQATNGGKIIGPLATKITSRVTSRIKLTAPVGSLAAIGTAQAIKMISIAMSEKIAFKLGAKAAAKTGGKWAATSTGIGAGAVLCSWSGPGAGLCAAVGGVGAWIVADYGIVKLDEYWTRDEFETDLRSMLDDQKKAQKAAFEQALAGKAAAARDGIQAEIQQHDFTLRELSGEGNAATCRTLSRMMALYEPLRASLSARTPAKLEELRNEISPYRSNPSLRRVVREIDNNLKRAHEARVSFVQITGNLPYEDRADRVVSGDLELDGAKLVIARTDAFAETGFNLNLRVSIPISVDKPVDVSLALEQHRHVFPNRHFGGSLRLDLLKEIGQTRGLEPSVPVFMPLREDDDTSGDADEQAALKSQSRVDLTLILRAEPMPALAMAPACD